MIPPGVLQRVEAALGPVRLITPVRGGCINLAARIDVDRATVFLKWNLDAPEGLFAAEADGLRKLGAATTQLRVPEVLDAWTEGLLLEWLEPAPRGISFSHQLGRALAALHQAPVVGPLADNWIGPLPQANTHAPSWAEFWINRRLEPQLRRALNSGREPGNLSEWERLFARIPEALAPAEHEGLSLLHGDLWSGNVLSTAVGPALVDPAVYRGHREVDLAMSELFGGFDAPFYYAYTEVWPLLPGYADTRRTIYQLYPLLVHVNLFGGAYIAQTAHLLRSACF
ncbi:fructosamine kinase family protein [soil metagenome]